MIDAIAYFSECGIRDVNQDAIYVFAKKGRGIFVVADGMGGHTGGEIASAAIVNGIKKWWESKNLADTKVEVDSVAEQCNSLLRDLNWRVFSYFNERGQVGGSTVVILIVWDDRYIILSAGDSRAYRVKARTLEQLTTDDVWENLPDVKYGMSNEQVVCDQRFGKLTEALGSEERLRINQCGGMLSGRELFFLCSDGVYKYCTHKELEKIICRGREFKSVTKIKKMICKCVKRNGTDDNYSAIICSIKLY